MAALCAPRAPLFRMHPANPPPLEGSKLDKNGRSQRAGGHATRGMGRMALGTSNLYCAPVGYCAGRSQLSGPQLFGRHTE